MDREHLIVVRQRILDSLLPLIMDGDGEPAERFSLIVSAIRAGAGTDELYDKAFEIANAIEDAGDKRAALYELLGEVEADMEQLTSPGETQQTESAEAQSSE